LLGFLDLSVPKPTLCQLHVLSNSSISHRPPLRFRTSIFFLYISPFLLCSLAINFATFTTCLNLEQNCISCLSSICQLVGGDFPSTRHLSTLFLKRHADSPHHRILLLMRFDVPSCSVCLLNTYPHPN